MIYPNGHGFEALAFDDHEEEEDPFQPSLSGNDLGAIVPNSLWFCISGFLESVRFFIVD